MIINREKKIKFSNTFESIKNTIKICCKLQINIIFISLKHFSCNGYSNLNLKNNTSPTLK